MDLKDLLLNLKMIMFGGKGGVGKTSCATSSAIWAAEHGRNTLIISTDPAHSLGDSLGMDLPPGEPTPVKDVENLTALEINPKAKFTELQELTDINPMKSMGMDGMMGDMMQGMLDGMMEGGEDGGSLNPPAKQLSMITQTPLEFKKDNKRLSKSSHIIANGFLNPR